MTDPSAAPSPYEVLGVREDAAAAEIRQAYLALARRYHPDHVAPTAPDAAEAGRRMQAINEAWAVLGDPHRRRRLDAESPRLFRPFDDGDDDPEPDPRLVPDVPYRASRPPTGVTRIATMSPVLLLAAAVTVASFGVVVNVRAVLAFAGFLFALSLAGFVVVPLLALGQASRDPG